MENLEWRPVKGYEGFFIISEFGDVKSIPREVVRSRGGNFFMKQGKVLNTFLTKGYKRVALRNGIDQKKFTIHRLVAEAFLEKEKGREYVNHLDSNRLNNHYSNLEWVSMQENNCHRIDKTKTTTKYIGVSWIKAKQRFTASICINKVQKTIGHFLTAEEAYAARCKYEKDNGIVNKYL